MRKEFTQPRHSQASVSGWEPFDMFRHSPPETRGGLRRWDFAHPSNLYVLPKQALLFKRAVASTQYQQSIDEPLRRVTGEVLRASASSFDGAARYVDLGPGFPDPTFSSLDPIISVATRLSYTPVDVNPRFLRAACLGASRKGLSVVRPLLHSFESLSRHQLGLRPQEAAIFGLGATFMNYEPDHVCVFCAKLRSARAKDSELVSPYQDRLNEAFNFSILDQIGFSRADVEYSVEFRGGAIEIGFHITKVPFHLESLGFRAGDYVVTARSYRHRRSDLLRQLRANFSLVRSSEEHDCAAIAIVSGS
jgi:hypothetical protein